MNVTHSVTPMITIKSYLLIAIMYVILTYRGIHTDIVITYFITFPLVVNTNIMIGYTYIPATVFLQVLPGLKCPAAWTKVLVWLHH